MYEAVTYRQFRHFVTASHDFASVLERSLGVSRSRIFTLHPGVDVARFSPGDAGEARSRLGLPLDVPLFATVRRLEPRMGISRALDAVAQIPGSHIAVCGTGSLRADLQARAASDARLREDGSTSSAGSPTRTSTWSSAQLTTPPSCPPSRWRGSA